MKRFGNNNGIALITVVIGVMFCLLLTSTMLRVSLLGLQSRGINNQVSDTFYDAESAVDIMRLNLQNIAAKAWRTTEDTTNSASFVQNTYKLLTGSDTFSTNQLTTAQYNKLKENLEAHFENGEIESFSKNLEFVYKDSVLEGLTIKDIQVKYTNPSTGMTSIVKTDITIRAPKYASDENPPLASFSLFAGTGAKLYNTNNLSDPGAKLGFFDQAGNVYIGWESCTRNADNSIKSAKALEITSYETIIFSGDNVIINGDIYVGTDSARGGHCNIQFTGKKVDVRGTIYLGSNCHLVIGTKTNLNCQDIKFKNSSGGYDSINSIDRDGGAEYERGVPLTYKDTSSSKSSNPYYSNATSIVYVENELKDSDNPRSGMVVVAGSVYDAKIDNGVVTCTDSGILAEEITGVIYLSTTDSKLKPKDRVTIYKDEQKTQVLGTYDEYFARIIDVPVFEQYMATEASRNNWINYIFNEDKYDIDPDTKKYSLKSGVTLSSALASSDANETFTFINESGVETSYTYGLRFESARIDDIVHTTDHRFFVTNLQHEWHVDGDDAYFDVVVFTSKNVEFKKDNGSATARSFFQLDTTSTHSYLKSFMEKVGRRVAKKNTDGAGVIEYCTFNNLFNGGIAAFWDESNNSSDPTKKINTQYNSKMDFIETSNFEKK